MIVRLGSIEVSDYERRLIGARMGERLATRAQVRRFVIDNGVLALDVLALEDDQRED